MHISAPSTTQKGFTLTELMIAIALGMSVISSVLLGYLATYTGSVSTLANSKLSQEMTTLMNLMVEDIRRAGFSTTVLAPASNPFNNPATTALAVFDSVAGNTQQAATGTGECVLYSYDRGFDGAVDNTELFGFRKNGDVVEMRTSGVAGAAPTCAGVGEWTALTDANFMTVDQLTFSLAASQCINNREPDNTDNDAANGIDDADEIDCYVVVPDTNNITVETRQVKITLEAHLTGDSVVSMQMEQDVRVRNDMVRVR